MLSTDFSSLCISAFPTDVGLDIVLQDEGKPLARSKLAYAHGLRGTLDGQPVDVRLDEKDATRFTLVFGDNPVTLRKQDKGHFFGWVRPLPPLDTRVDADQFMQLARAALGGKKRK